VQGATTAPTPPAAATATSTPEPAQPATPAPEAAAAETATPATPTSTGAKPGGKGIRSTSGVRQTTGGGGKTKIKKPYNPGTL
jgi:hypothetical protein